MEASALTIQVLLLLAVFVVFYLTLVRPQQAKLRRHQRMLENMRPGDRISTNGGLVGTIVNTDREGLVILEVAPSMHVSVTRKGIDEVWPSREVNGVHDAVNEQQPSASLG